MYKLWPIKFALRIYVINITIRYTILKNKYDNKKILKLIKS